jgi:hypothetical protein
VSWNEIRGEGAKSICHALADHSGLTALDMSWNSIGQHHGEGLATAEDHPSSPAHSDRKSSPPKSPVGKRPVNTAPGSSRYALFYSRRGCLLLLRNRSHAGSAAAEALASLLAANSTLLHISISHNKFSGDDCDCIGIYPFGFPRRIYH